MRPVNTNELHADRRLGLTVEQIANWIDRSSAAITINARSPLACAL